MYMDFVAGQKFEHFVLEADFGHAGAEEGAEGFEIFCGGLGREAGGDETLADGIGLECHLTDGW